MKRVVLFILFVGAMSTGVLLRLLSDGHDAAGHGAVATLPLLVALLVAGESLLIRFRYRDQIDTVNLMEAVLAPLLFAFTGPVVVGSVFSAQLVSAVIRRNKPVKALFNITQWTLAAGVGSLIAAHGAGRSTLGSLAFLFIALAVVGIVNQLALTGVLALVSETSPGAVVASLRSLIFPGLVVSWTANVALGLLFVFAYETHSASTVLFALPLAALHLAYRSAAVARTDRRRIAGAHRAISVLDDPLDPDADVEPFLREIATAFEAPTAALVVLVDDGGGDVLVHRFDATSGELTSFSCRRGDAVLEVAVLQVGGSGRLRAGDRKHLADEMVAAGHRDCVYAVSATSSVVLGVIVCDQLGLEGAGRDEEEFISGLVREAAALIERRRLLVTVFDERQKLADIVTSTSDGIFTLSDDGTIRMWNPALEAITGLAARDVIGSRNVLDQLHPRSLDGSRVELHGWGEGRTLPAELRITNLSGEPRRLACSYSRIDDSGDGDGSMVVVARDTTPVEEMETLRAQFGRLAEAEAVQRDIVDRLQQAVMPLAPPVSGTDIAVQYVSSDPASPTGGDLYDWHVLPSGDVHVAVVDVLGHGVDATRDALAVIHALRVLAVQGCPLEKIVEEANVLLSAQSPELVATVMVCRYQPDDGTVQLAGGGHPAPLLASRYEGVQEIDAPGGTIGWPSAGSLGVAVRQLEPGDALLLYTDGVVEAGKDLLLGTQRLMENADRFAHLPAEEYTVRLLDTALAGATRRDDSLLLVLRRCLPPAQDRRWELSPDPAEVRRVRHEVAAFARTCAIAEEEIDRMQVVVSELVTNAVRAARSTIVVELGLGDLFAELTVTDDGPGFEAFTVAETLEIDLEAENGRGLPLVSTWTDDLVILPAPDGTIVRARLAWDADAASVREMEDAYLPATPQPLP